MIEIPFIPEYNSLKWHTVGQIKSMFGITFEKYNF
jgi:hypothetical protein